MSLSASLENIGFFAGALRIHDRELGLVEALRRDTAQVQRAELLGTGVVQARSRHSSVSRSHVAPANVVRVIRWVRLGALPETTYRSGEAITGFSELVPSAFSSISPLTW